MAAAARLFSSGYRCLVVVAWSSLPVVVLWLPLRFTMKNQSVTQIASGVWPTRSPKISGAIIQVVAASLLVCCLPPFAGAQDASGVETDTGWGNLSGRVVVTGDVPSPAREPIDGHPDGRLCLIDGQPPEDDSIVIDQNGGLRDVFVMLYLKRNAGEVPVHRSYEASSDDRPLVIDNVDCRFQPHALFVRSGQSVLLKNSDSVGHNCHITTFNNEHNVNLPPGQEVRVTLKNSDRIPGQVTCDIHKWMDAVILVRDNPYVAITDSQGRFKIDNLPAGQWQFQFWHQKAGYMRKLKSGDYKIGRKGQTDVRIESGSSREMGTLEFSADAFK